MNGVMSHGNFSYPRNTQRTRKKILVEDYSKDFVLDLPIGYFCHDSAKNKFLDLFSALAAPKIRASMMRSITKRTHKARYSSAFWSEILVKDSLLSKEKILDMI